MAAKEAEKEFLKRKILEVKESILKTLEKMEEKKKDKEKIEEELRILKLDLDDLRKGDFDKIAKRQNKSDVAKEVSVSIPSSWTTTSNNTGQWFYYQNTPAPYANNNHNHSGAMLSMNGASHSHNVSEVRMNESQIFWTNATRDTYKTRTGKVYFF